MPLFFLLLQRALAIIHLAKSKDRPMEDLQGICNSLTVLRDIVWGRVNALRGKFHLTDGLDMIGADLKGVLAIYRLEGRDERTQLRNYFYGLVCKTVAC